MAATAEPHRLAPDHVRAGPIVNVQIEPVGCVGRGEEGAQRSAQRLVVARDDEHGHRFAAVARRPHDQMAQNSAKGRTRRGHVRLGEVLVQREGDVVGPRLVHRALGDRNDGARVHRVVADHGRAAIGRFAEDERGLGPEAPRRARRIGPHADHRFDCRRVPAERGFQQIGETLPLAFQLRRVGEVLPVTSPAGPEVPADVFHNGVGPIPGFCVPCGLSSATIAESATIVRPVIPPRTPASRWEG